MSRITLPPSLLLGAATASYQIEGAWDRDGKGESIWDRFAHTAGRIRDGTSGDVACDHYSRVGEDVALMKSLGLQAYRFSTSWPRILPSGTGHVEARGLDFYSRLVDGLLEAEILPVLTLYHWDLPQALQDRGGWTHRDVADWMGEYAAVVARRLGDRVHHFIPLNEPQIFTVLGHLQGHHAPGIVDFVGCVRAMHHANLAHGRAVQALRAERSGAKIGTALQTPPVHPVTDSAEDGAAAERFDGWFNRWFLDPVILGRWPEGVFEALGPARPPIVDGDLDVIHQPLDFVGINNYFRTFVRNDPEVPLLGFAVAEHHRVEGAEYTAMGWEVYPSGLHEILTRLRVEYGNPPVWITENGCALDDVIEDGKVHDPRRIRFHQRYLAAAYQAITEGSKLEAYFAWSLFDNFEWAYGLSRRFGLVHVDYETGRRVPKASALWYRDLIVSRVCEAP